MAPVANSTVALAGKHVDEDEEVSVHDHVDDEPEDEVAALQNALHTLLYEDALNCPQL
jgi:uncharacterized protein YprB with RNaseH-like and TPR domain